MINGTDIKSYSIIYGKDSSKSEKTAAYEFAKYIEKTCGEKLEIRDDSFPEKDYEVVIGNTNRKDARDYLEEEYDIFTENSSLYILGGRVRGALYGVYAFFEKFLGWRWYSPTFEKCTLTEDVNLSDIKLNEKPMFEYRDVYYYSAFDPLWSVKMKVNGAVTRRLDDELGGGVGYAGEHFVHTFNVFMPIEKYFETNPEYFALKDGKRNGQFLYTQLCLTNPDVLRIMTEEVIKRLEENPDARIISVSQDDSFVGDSYCHCSECEKIHEEEGSPMGTLLRFVNSIADSVSERFPNVAIDTLAYQHTFRPPTITRPRENVIIRLCTWNPELAYTHEEKENILEALHIWRDICKRIYIWDYTANFSDYLVTVPNFRNLRPNINLFARNNVRGVFAQGNYQSESGEFGELKSYLLAKLLWNPLMSEEEYNWHLDDFLKGYYGKGFESIRRYIDYTQDIVKGSDASMRGNPLQILPKEKFDYDLCESWWNRALSEAEDEDTRYRIRKSMLQLLHWKHFSEGYEDKEEFFKQLREFDITALREGENVPVPSSDI